MARVNDMQVRQVDTGRRRYLGLLLLADPSEAMILGYLNRGHLLVAELGGRTIGVAHLDPLSPADVELKNLAVVEDLQGQGYGRRLLQAAADFSRAQGYHRLVVGTGNSSLHNLAFYQRAGFRLTEVRRNYFLHHYSEPIYENGIRCQDLVMMDLLLGPDRGHG